MTRRLHLFGDAVARGWAPFSTTRPAGELLFGALLLRERIERAIGHVTECYRGPAELVGFDEAGAPPVRDPTSALPDATRILLCSRYQPPLAASSSDPSIELPMEVPDGGIRLTVEGRTAGWILPEGAADPGADRLSEPERDDGSDGWDSLPPLELPGRLIPDLWTLMAENRDRITEDLTLLFPGGEGESAGPLHPASGVHRLGDHPVSVEEGVEVEPGVVLDARDGPIHLARGVRIRAPARLEGPAFIGPGSVVLGGVLGALSCGPVCKLHGEIDSSVILGYVNKAHDGYLGHAVLGRWVNLGAMTTNSDLKNTYGSVRVPGPDGTGEIDTGRMKVGVFLGDHVKTGIGTLLNTGSIVGAGSNVFGGAMPPRWVPPFSWGAGAELGAYRKDSFLTTAERVMSRRDVVLSPSMRSLLERAWERARGHGAPDRPPSDAEREA